MTLHPQTLVACLDQLGPGHMDPGDRRALQEALRRATRAASPTGDVIASEGGTIGRILPHGSAVLYRPDRTAPLRHRVLEVDAGGAVTAAFDRDPVGGLRGAWVRLARGNTIGLLPGEAEHPLWGLSDRVVRAAPGGGLTVLTLAGAVTWGAVDTIPPVAEPARLPIGAGPALLNALAAVAEDQGHAPLRYRGPYPTEQLFWSLTESFRFAVPVEDREAGPGPVERFLGDAEGTFARGAMQEAPLDWTPAPHERRLLADGLVVQLRDGVERITWQDRGYHRTERQRLRRREHRVVRVEGRGEARCYVASLVALGTVVEDHLVLGEHGELLARHASAADPGREAPLATPWREALGALLPLEATPLLTGAIEAVWPEFEVAWGPVPGDLIEARGLTLRLSPKLARVYRSLWAAAPAAGRRSLAQQLVREVLGLIGPAVREAAASRLEALPGVQQEVELAAAARRDRVVLAAAALAPLGRLLAAVEAGAALPE